MLDAELAEFVNDENNFKNLLFLFGHPDGDEYLDKVLPLLDAEKISYLLSKDERVVDKVYHLGQQPGPLADVIKTIYDAKTNQALVNKLDGNSLLTSLGYKEYWDFWFNSSATEEGLAAMCEAIDPATKTFNVGDNSSREKFLEDLAANLHWDVKKEWAYALFASLSYTLVQTKVELDQKWGRAWNYLAAQLVRHKIDCGPVSETVKALREKFDGIREIRYIDTAESGGLDGMIEEKQKKEEENASMVTLSGFGGVSGTFITTGLMQVSWGNTVAKRGSLALYFTT